MLHEIAETMINAGRSYNVYPFLEGIYLWESEDGTKLERPRAPFLAEIISSTPLGQVWRHSSPEPVYTTFMNCVLPKTGNIIRWLGNPKYWEILEYGAYLIIDGEANDLISDTFALKMEKGALRFDASDWKRSSFLTPQNYPPLRKFLDHVPYSKVFKRYNEHTIPENTRIVYPQSYDGMVKALIAKVDYLTNILHDYQIFYI